VGTLATVFVVRCAGDDPADWRPRFRNYDPRTAGAVAGARQYAAEVTDRAQRSMHAGPRQYSVDGPRYAAAEEPGHRAAAWNGRPSYAESTVSRASDPVGWSLLNDAPGSTSSSAWASSSFALDLYRRRRRQLRMASPPSWSGADAVADRAESPPSWQTQSLHGQRTDHTAAAVSLPPFPRRRSAAENAQPAASGLRPAFQETSSLADVDLWPSRRDRDATSSFAPIFLDDIENDAEEITSTGAEAGSTASIGGDTESMDADGDVRSSDFELGSIGAEVLVSSSSGSGAEIGIVDPPPRASYEGFDYGPSAGGDLSSLRSSGFGTSRTSDHVDSTRERDRSSQRRWRRFNAADLPDRANRNSSSSAAASNGSLRISDWLEFDWSGDVVPRRLPQRLNFLDFFESDRDRNTSAASDVPRPRDYVRSRRSRPRYSGSGAASNSALDPPHECLPNCDICNNGGLGRLPEPSHWSSQLSTETGSSRSRPFNSYELLAPAASAVDDDDPVAGELDPGHDAIPSFPPSIDPARYPAIAEFERRVRRVDEQMRRRLGAAADREPPRSSLAHRLRERQEALRSQLRSSQYLDDVPSSSHRHHDDSFPAASSSSAGYGSTGEEAVSDFISMGEQHCSFLVSLVILMMLQPSA